MDYIEIRLRDVRPNPYRQLERYHLQPARLKSLESSIEDTGFWSNIIGRLNDDDTFEIAYGHHRLQAAINVLGEDHFQSFPIADLQDYAMLQMMVRVNSEHWGCTSEHNNLAVEQVRDFLDGILDTYPTWDAALAAPEFDGKAEEWFGNEMSYIRAVKHGVGESVLHKFMGNMTHYDVQQALRQVGPSEKQQAAQQAKIDKQEAKAQKAKKSLAAAKKALKAEKTAAAKAQAEAELKYIQDELEKADAAREALIKQLDKAGTYDRKAGEEFTKPVHADAFRNMVLSPRFEGLMPKENQLAFAQGIKLKLKQDAKEVTAKTIESYGNAILDKHKQAQIKADPAARYLQLLKAIHQKAAGVELNLRELREAMRKDGVTEFEGPEAVKLDEKLSKLSAEIGNYYLSIGGEAPILVLHDEGDFPYYEAPTGYARISQLEKLNVG